MSDLRPVIVDRRGRAIPDPDVPEVAVLNDRLLDQDVPVGSWWLPLGWVVRAWAGRVWVADHLPDDLVVHDFLRRIARHWPATTLLRGVELECGCACVRGLVLHPWMHPLTWDPGPPPRILGVPFGRAKLGEWVHARRVVHAPTPSAACVRRGFHRTLEELAREPAEPELSLPPEVYGRLGRTARACRP